MSDRRAKRARLLTPRFTLVVSRRALLLHRARDAHAGAARLRREVARHGSVAVGIAVGAFAVGAVLLRPFAGRHRRPVGRRVLIVGGALDRRRARPLCYGARRTAVVPRAAARRHRLRRSRLLRRRGDDDHRPRAGRPAGRGGELLVGRGVRRALVRAGARRRCCTATHVTTAWCGSCRPALALAGRRSSALFTVEVERPAHAEPRRRHLLHRAAVGPGTVLFLGLIPLAGFTAFVPLYVDDLHVERGRDLRALRRADPRRARLRRAAARPARRRAHRRRSRWSSSARRHRADRGVADGRGLGRRHVVFAAGMSLMYPALLLLALDGVSDAERASVVGTFSSFFDLSQGLGALICGAVVAVRRRPGRVHDRRGLRGRPVSSCCGRAREQRVAAATCATPRRVAAVPSLLVTNDFPPKLGGIQSYLYELWRRLPPGETTVLTTPFPGAAEWDAQQDVPDRAGARARAAARRRRVARRIDALAREVGADVIFLDPMLPLGLVGPRLTAAPYVVIAHGGEITGYARTPGSRRLGAAGDARRGGGRGRRARTRREASAARGRPAARRRRDPARRRRRALPSARRRRARRGPPPVRARSRPAARARRVAAGAAQGLRRGDRRGARRSTRRAARDRGRRAATAGASSGAAAGPRRSSSAGCPTPTCPRCTRAPTCSRCVPRPVARARGRGVRDRVPRGGRVRRARGRGPQRRLARGGRRRRDRLRRRRRATSARCATRSARLLADDDAPGAHGRGGPPAGRRGVRRTTGSSTRAGPVARGDLSAVGPALPVASGRERERESAPVGRSSSWVTLARVRGHDRARRRRAARARRRRRRRRARAVPRVAADLVYAFGLAVVRSARGDDIGVGNLFFLIGLGARRRAPPAVRRARRCRSWSAGATAWANAFAVLEPMLPLALRRLWGARHGDVPAAPTAATVHRAVAAGGPMTDTASERIRVEAPADRCFDVAVDFESYPEWLRDVKEAKILEVDDEGRGLRGRVPRRRARQEHPLRARVRLHRRARARSRGSSSRATCCAGSTARTASSPRARRSTRVHYDLAVELAMPLPGLVKRRAAGLIMGSALKELKKQVEAVA